MRMALMTLVAVLMLAGCGNVSPPSPTFLQANPAGITSASVTQTAQAGGAATTVAVPPTPAATNTAIVAINVVTPTRGATPSAAPGAATPASTTLVGDWALVTLQAAGRDAEALAPGSAALALRADGRARARGDCNDFDGTYTADERGGLAFHLATMSLAGCPGLEREQRYFATLQQARGYQLDGDTLRLIFDQPGLQLVYRRTGRSAFP